MGTCQTPGNKNPHWVGGTRTPPIPPAPPPGPLGPNPPEADPKYNDGNWTVINAPHDSLIGNTVSKDLCPSGCSGRSYIPRYVSWRAAATRAAHPAPPSAQSHTP